MHGLNHNVTHKQPLVSLILDVKNDRIKTRSMIVYDEGGRQSLGHSVY